MLLPNRIPVSLRPSGVHTLTTRELTTRAAERSNTIWIIIGVVGAVIILIVVTYLFTKRRLGKGLKDSKRGRYHQTNDSESLNTHSARSNRRHGDSAVTEANRGTNRDGQIDRNTSVRTIGSIMTLPEYRGKPNENEQVLGREGERDGVDTVVEYPTEENIEALRDEEMETMYQIRVARRQMNADREERRRLAEEARARGDHAALEELRAQRRAASNTNEVVSDLREQHEQVKGRRNRTVSSVSYQDLGVARHDGSRLRASSTDSERLGLLSDAASIALSTRSPSALSNRSPSAQSNRSPSALTQHRDRSASSVLSLDENADIPSPGLRSGATTPRFSSFHTRAGSSPEIIGEADLGASQMPPPDYDDVSLDDVRSGATTPMFNEPPPDYTDPSSERDRRLSAQVADMVEHVSESGDLSSPDDLGDDSSRRSSHRSSRGAGSIPQLPSLRIGRLPQIVIEPSTAHPSDHNNR